MSSDASFNQLLRLSKVMHLNPSTPVAVTAHAGYLHRGDFGLKRPLPLAAVGRTPYVKVRGLDAVAGNVRAGGNGTTDFVTSARETLFIKRWEESGASATADYESSSFFLESSMFDSKSWTKTIPTESGKLPANDSREALLPELASLDEQEMAVYTQQLEHLQPEFQAFIQKEKKREKSARKAENRKRKAEKLRQSSPSEQIKAAEQSGSELENAQTSAVAVDDSNGAAATDIAVNPKQQEQAPTDDMDYIVRFLCTKPAQDAFARAAKKKKGREPIAGTRDSLHPVAALNYAPANRFHAEYTSRPIPVRQLQQAPIGKRDQVFSGGPENIVSALGLSALARQKESSSAGLTDFGPQRADEPKGKTVAKIIGAPVASTQDKNNDGNDGVTRPTWHFEYSIGGLRQLENDTEAAGVARVPSLSVSPSQADQDLRKPQALFGSPLHISPITEAQSSEDEKKANLDKHLRQMTQKARAEEDKLSDFLFKASASGPVRSRSSNTSGRLYR